jgi:hypothetical protein
MRDHISKGPLRDFKTGTGFAGAKLSEILHCARVARFAQDDSKKSDRSDCAGRGFVGGADEIECEPSAQRIDAAHLHHYRHLIRQRRRTMQGSAHGEICEFRALAFAYDISEDWAVEGVTLQVAQNPVTLRTAFELAT